MTIAYDLSHRVDGPLQLVEATYSRLADNNLDNQPATSLLTICNKLVVNKLSQAMQTHPDH